jgi:hypothetical protein
LDFERLLEPLRVTGEVKEWEGHSPDQPKAMRDHLAHLKQIGVEAVDG